MIAKLVWFYRFFFHGIAVRVTATLVFVLAVSLLAYIFREVLFLWFFGFESFMHRRTALEALGVVFIMVALIKPVAWATAKAIHGITTRFPRFSPDNPSPKDVPAT